MTEIGDLNLILFFDEALLATAGFATLNGLMSLILRYLNL